LSFKKISSRKLNIIRFVFLSSIFLSLWIVESGCAVLGSSHADKENNFGVSSAKQGMWNEAMFRWEKVLNSDPNNVAALNNLGVAYSVKGDYEKAISFIRKAMEQKPNNRHIKKNYESLEKVLNAAEKSEEEAIENLEEIEDDLQTTESSESGNNSNEQK